MPKKKILIVDDSVSIRKALREILHKLNFDVVGEAGAGTEALKQFTLLAPDIILLDIMMPQLGGIETLRMLRSMNKNVKIVMVTAVDSLEKVKECMRAGANHYILKPFEETKVADVLSKIAGD